MKKILTFLTGIILSMTIVCAQEAPPMAFSYKATIYKPHGWIACRKTISLKVSILQGSADGLPVYTEFFTPTTNDFGQVDVVIGKGSNGDLSTVKWGNSLYFLKTEADVKGGNDYELLSVVQLLSVPYALYSGEAGNGFASEYSATGKRPVLDENGNVSLGASNGSNARLNVSGDINFTGELLKNGLPFITTTKITAGTNITVTGSGTESSPYIINTSVTSSSNHYIGELFGGGIVFYVDHNGQHGLITFLQNFNSAWSNVNDAITIDENSSWNGLYNSNAIVAQAGHTLSAAKYCLDLSVSGFDDWYLPSVDQLNLLFNSRYELNKVLAGDGNPSTEPLLQSSYWSSTQFVVPFMASALNMQDGTSACLDKSTAIAVRAIRDF